MAIAIYFPGTNSGQSLEHVEYVECLLAANSFFSEEFVEGALIIDIDFEGCWNVWEKNSKGFIASTLNWKSSWCDHLSPASVRADQRDRWAMAVMAWKKATKVLGNLDTDDGWDDVLLGSHGPWPVT